MTVRLTRRAVKDLDKLERDQPALYERVISRVVSLADDPNAGKPLVGPLIGKRAVRVGAMRIIYEVRGGSCEVLTINHRGEVYR